MVLLLRLQQKCSACATILVLAGLYEHFQKVRPCQLNTRILVRYQGKCSIPRSPNVDPEDLHKLHAGLADVAIAVSFGVHARVKYKQECEIEHFVHVQVES